MDKSKPLAGHKCKGITVWVSVSCECGWSSVHNAGPGARRSAYNEWRWHIDQCKKNEAR